MNALSLAYALSGNREEALRVVNRIESSSIVASLWKVDDLATAYLMTQFYANLKKTGKQAALRSAQLETRSKYPHPFYWASFQLTGNAK